MAYGGDTTGEHSGGNRGKFMAAYKKRYGNKADAGAPMGKHMKRMSPIGASMKKMKAAKTNEYSRE